MYRIKTGLLFIMLLCVVNLDFVALGHVNQVKHRTIQSNSNRRQCDYNKIRILEVESNGVQAIVVARLLAEIENRTEKYISELFNIGIAGNTGGLVMLSTAAPHTFARTKYSSDFIVNWYLMSLADIFNDSLRREWFKGFLPWGAKYDRSGLEQMMSELFRGVQLSNAAYPIYLPIYSISDAKHMLVSTKAAHENPNDDFFLRDLAAATSFPGSYFDQQIFHNVLGNGNYTRPEGGIFVRDPEIIAGVAIYEQCPTLALDEIMFVSIGTGEVEERYGTAGNSTLLDWLKDKDLITQIVADDSNLNNISGKLFKHKKYKLRVQIPKSLSKIDKASDDNLKKLLELTEEYIQRNDEVIEEIARKLRGINSELMEEGAL